MVAHYATPGCHQRYQACQHTKSALGDGGDHATISVSKQHFLLGRVKSVWTFCMLHRGPTGPSDLRRVIACFWWQIPVYMTAAVRVCARPILIFHSFPKLHLCMLWCKTLIPHYTAGLSPTVRHHQALTSPRPMVAPPADVVALRLPQRLYTRVGPGF